MKRYKLTLNVLSPLHIGSGEQLTGFDFVINKHCLYRLDFHKMIGALEDKEKKELELYLDNGEYREAMSLMGEAAGKSEGKAALYTARTTRQIEEWYTGTSSELPLEPVIKSGGIPYIPGSSIKGALRTGYLSRECLYHNRKYNSLVLDNEIKEASREIESYNKDKKLQHYLFHKELKTKTFKFKGKEKTEHILLQPEHDPFRCIQVEDAYLKMSEKNNLEAGMARLYGGSKKGVFPKKTHVPLEVVIPGAAFETIITFNEKVFRAMSKKVKDFSIQTILNHSHEFYTGYVTRSEIEGFWYKDDKINFSSGEYHKLMEKIRNFINGSILLRLGRFSHIAAMTFPMGIRKQSGYTHMFYEEQKLPFGFMRVDIKEV